MTGFEDIYNMPEVEGLQIVLVFGAAGNGKTMLLEHFLRQKLPAV